MANVLCLIAIILNRPVGLTFTKNVSDQWGADLIQCFLKQLQANHQADGVARPANACCIQAAKLALQCFSVNPASERTQFVAQIYQIDQLLAKQVNIGVVNGLA